MSEPFIGEIRMFAGNFAPRGWAFCDGQLLAISQNDALFALFGTTYGGDGRTTFGLPDLRGRVPVHQGTGPGLSVRPMGSRGGVERASLTTGQMPAHAHRLASANPPSSSTPRDNVIANGVAMFIDDALPGPALAANATQSVGGGQSHNNLMPYLCVNFIVALFGIFPSRS